MEKFIYDPRWNPSDEQLEQFKQFKRKRVELRKNLNQSTDIKKLNELKKEIKKFVVPKLNYKHQIKAQQRELFLMEKAYLEEKKEMPERIKNIFSIGNPSGFILFPRSYVELTNRLLILKKKQYKYNFIGRLFNRTNKRRNISRNQSVEEWEVTEFNEDYWWMYFTRVWAYIFAKDHFKKGDFFKATDQFSLYSDYVFLNRDYDFTKRPNFPHKKKLELEEFLKVLADSEFTLCPAGDEPWSLRVNEAILCMSIPVVEKKTISVEIDWKK